MKLDEVPTQVIEKLASDVHENWFRELKKQEKGVRSENWKTISDRDKELFRVAVRTVVNRLHTLETLDTTQEFPSALSVVVNTPWHEMKIPAGPMLPEAVLRYLGKAEHRLDREERLTIMILLGYTMLLTGTTSGVELSATQVIACSREALSALEKENKHS